MKRVWLLHFFPSLSQSSPLPPAPPLLGGGRYPFHPRPFMFHATRPPSCSSQISSLQVHHDHDDALDAAVIARRSGFELPCGEMVCSGVEMSTQQTKWWLPSAGKQCWVSGEARSRVPQGAGGAGSAEQKERKRRGRRTRSRRDRGPRQKRAIVFSRFRLQQGVSVVFSLFSFARGRRDSNERCRTRIGGKTQRPGRKRENERWLDDWRFPLFPSKKVVETEKREKKKTFPDFESTRNKAHKVATENDTRRAQKSRGLFTRNRNNMGGTKRDISEQKKGRACRS